MTITWGMNRKSDMLRFLKLASKLTRSAGFYLCVQRAFPKGRYQ